MRPPIRSSQSSVFTAALLCCVGAAARAAPSASLAFTATLDTGAALTSTNLLNGESFTLNVQYTLNDLPSDGAFIELDTCAPGIAPRGYPSGGDVEWTHLPSCLDANGNAGLRERSPHIGSSGSATQAVTGIWSITLATEQIIDGDNTVWNIPVRVVIDSTARPTLVETPFTAIGHIKYTPQLVTSVLGVVAADGPTGAPGYDVTFRLQPVQYSWITGVYPMPHTDVVATAPQISGGQFVSSTTYPESNLAAYGPAFFGPPFNINKTVTTADAWSTGVPSQATFSLDDLVWLDPTDTVCDMVFWFPKAPTLDAKLDVVATFSDGETATASPDIILGNGLGSGWKQHRNWNGWYDTSAANSPNLGDNPTDYVGVDGLIEWWIHFGFTTANWAPVAGVNPEIVDALPAHVQVFDISALHAADNTDLLPIATISISTDTPCDPHTGAWTVIGAHDAASLRTARCLRATVPGIVQQSLDFQYVARLDPDTEAALRAVPNSYEFEDNTAWLTIANSAGSMPGLTTWSQDPSFTELVDRLTVENAGSPSGYTYPAQWSFPLAAVGDDIYSGFAVPQHSVVNPSGAYQDLTFEETLPLELDLTGAPHPWPGNPLPVDASGATMTPVCTWNAQDRTQLPIVPAHWKCTFPGEFPILRPGEDPFSSPGCVPGNEYCFNSWQNKDSSGNYIFNFFYMQVPQHIVSGYQGQVIDQTMQVWSTRPLDQSGNPLPASSEATAYSTGPTENTLVINGSLQMVMTDTGSVTTVPAGGTVSFDVRYHNSGSASIADTRIYDLLGRDSTSGAPLAGCETPRLVSVANAGGDPAPLIEYTTDANPLPSASSSWSLTAPSDLSLVTGVRITPVSAFSSTPGIYGPNDPAGHFQLQVADTAGAGATLCNSAAIVGRGFAIAGSTAAPAEVVASCQEEVLYAPAQGDSGLLLFEDLWPANGDADFNDETIAYQEKFLLEPGGLVSAMQIGVNVLSVGAQIHNGVHLRLPLPASALGAGSIVRFNEDGSQTTLTARSGESQLVIDLVDDTRSLFARQDPFINTVPTVAAQQGQAFSVRITFGQPQALETGLAPFDLFLARTGAFGHQIHQASYGGTDGVDASLFNTADDRSTSAAHYVNEAGLPFALHIPTLTPWPQERIDIGAVFGAIANFAATAGAQDADWYTHFDASKAFTQGGGSLAPTPHWIGPDLTACGGAQ